MIKLRFTRIGKRNEPAFRIVAMEARSKRDGEALEYLGFYNPISKAVQINKERIEYWLHQGAQPSSTVKYLLVKQGVLKAAKQKKEFKKQPGRKKTAKATKGQEQATKTKEKQTAVKQEAKAEVKKTPAK